MILVDQEYIKFQKSKLGKR